MFTLFTADVNEKDCDGLKTTKLFSYSSKNKEYPLTAGREISRIQRPFSMGFSGENTVLFWQQHNTLPKTPMFN